MPSPPSGHAHGEAYPFPLHLQGAKEAGKGGKEGLSGVGKDQGELIPPVAVDLPAQVLGETLQPLAQGL
ncbi:hypothetical protein TthHB5008_03630 [Thermus thermophilus]|nr:hypothetical protein TthHB5002_03650 [Thermus thermophilus]BCP99592.1 hypothetical protein TthHB5008_03630 [Thermus thermophilus]BDG23176.1 hypothetical protein TthSNM33_03700 [Thermus thermophilus]BDG27074.1 hypothetical protein TthSNM66_17100 [Thermus thermophilus]